MLARSHVALAVAPYLALLCHPPPLPAAVPVLGLPAGEAATDPVVAVALSAGVVAVAALAPASSSTAAPSTAPRRPSWPASWQRCSGSGWVWPDSACWSGTAGRRPMGW
jgi:hypothetical protein